MSLHKESIDAQCRCHKMDSCQRLLQVGGKPFAIVGTVQESVDIEEHIFMPHFGAVFFPCALKNEITHAGMPSIILVASVKQG